MSVKQSRWCITHVDLIVKDLFKVNTAKKKKGSGNQQGKKKTRQLYLTASLFR